MHGNNSCASSRARLSRKVHSALLHAKATSLCVPARCAGVCVGAKRDVSADGSESRTQAFRYGSDQPRA